MVAEIEADAQKPLFAIDTAANFKLLLCVVLSISTMVLDYRYQRLDLVRDALSTLVFPLTYMLQLPVLTSRELSRGLLSYEELQTENERLRQRQRLLETQLLQLNTLESENRRLRALLSSTTQRREKTLIAELLRVDDDPYRHRISLDKGKIHGVRLGLPLIDQYGVVGQVMQVTPFSARAILISDPNHTMQVQVNRNNLRTLARGSGQYNRIILPYMPNNSDVREGDLLMTTGLDGRFPRGYPVGRVVDVKSEPGQPFARVSAQPLAQLDRLREVLILLPELPQSLEYEFVGPPAPEQLATSATAN